MAKQRDKRGSDGDLAPGLLARHRHGAPDALEFLGAGHGFLRLCHDERDGLLRRIEFVWEPNAMAKAQGASLLLELAKHGASEVATFIANNAISAVQWQHGHAYWGHTLDDDGPTTGPTEPITLDDWVDSIVEKMVRRGDVPGPEIDLKPQIARVRAGDGEARDILWRTCTPRSEAAVKAVLGLLDPRSSDLLFACGDPLRRATTGHAHILERVTEVAERTPKPFDRSELYEVLEVHAAAASPKLVARWCATCRAAIAEKGAHAFAADAHAALFSAIAASPGSEAVRAFAAETLAYLEKISEGPESFSCFTALKNAARPTS